MISRGQHPATWDVSCDRCSGGHTEVEADDFRAAIAAVKQQGWRVRPTGGGFDHLCPDCSSAEAANAVRGPLL